MSSIHLNACSHCIGIDLHPTRPLRNIRQAKPHHNARFHCIGNDLHLSRPLRTNRLADPPHTLMAEL